MYPLNYEYFKRFVYMNNDIFAYMWKIGNRHISQIAIGAFCRCASAEKLELQFIFFRKFSLLECKCIN